MRRGGGKICKEKPSGEKKIPRRWIRREMTGGMAFFKILIDVFSERLRIPPAFIKNISVKIPERSVLTSSGKNWHVDVNKIGNDLYFEKGWQDFVRDRSLRCGVLLIFRHRHDFVFDVEIFERNGCKKVDNLADKNHNSISPCTEGLEPQYGRRELAKDKTNKVMDSSVSSEGKGPLAANKNRGIKAVMAEGTCTNDESVRMKMPHISEGPYVNNYFSHEHCGTSTETNQIDLQRPRRKMSLLNHSVHGKSVLSDRQDVRGCLVNGTSVHISHGKRDENCDICIVSSSSQRESDQVHRKKMKASLHLPYSDQLPYHRRQTRKSSVPSKSTHTGHKTEKGNKKVNAVPYSGNMSNNCDSGISVLRRSLRLRSIQSDRKEGESDCVEKVGCPIDKKESESYQLDSASSSRCSDPIEPSEGSESQNSIPSSLDGPQKTSHQGNERDDSSRKISTSLGEKVSVNLDANASVKGTKCSSPLEKHHSLGQDGTESTDEDKSFPEPEYAYRSSSQHTSLSPRCSYIRFMSKRRFVTQEEKDSALIAARNFKSRVPFFIVVMKPTNVYKGFIMTIPCSFVEAHISEKDRYIVLTTSSNRKWPVECRVRKRNWANFGKGWAAFALDNNLEEGDACVFELDKGDGLTFMVHIFRVVDEVVPLCRNA